MTMKETMTAKSLDAPKRQITIERTYRAPIEDVWDRWTTKEGIESWWGPERFAVKVRKVDLRPGGQLLYARTTIAPEQIEFMQKAGMHLTTEAQITYTAVTPWRRLVYTHLVDFVPDVEPYDVAIMVELLPSETDLKMILTIDAMHDEEWTKRAIMGWESELGKLGKVLESRK